MRSWWLSWILLGIRSDPCEYGNCHPTVNNKLNVHLVPHSHDDVGWLKTVDQYYYGSNDTIKWANAGVQYILDTVVPNLLADPSKRFIFVETAFFWRWWGEQDDSMKTTVKKLVTTGQLEFILGGWCMNDEAVVHYTGMIQQLALGINYLTDQFGSCGYPKVGWQIDPFGHSKTQAEVFALAGFDGLFFGRADYQDKLKRQKDRRMEFLWQTRKTGDFNIGSLFTGLNEHGYNPPDGFCFDWVCAGDQPIMDDKRLHDYNVDDVIKRFKKAAEDQRKHFKGNNIMMTMGSDFQYRNAFMWYKNLDKLIKYVNEADVGLNLMYSTPSCYLKSKNDELIDLEEVSDDFFPYADGPHMFWTGYFTSRAALKRYVRETNVYLKTCKLAEIHLKHQFSDKVAILERAFAEAQHHDAVSGTERQHVAADYAMRLSEGRSACEDVIQAALHEPIIKCDYLNISVCETTTTNDAFGIVVINPSNFMTSHMITIPIDFSSEKDINVTSEDGQALPYAVTATLSGAVRAQKGHMGGSRHQLNIFTGRLTGFSVNRIRVRMTDLRQKRSLNYHRPQLLDPIYIPQNGKKLLNIGSHTLELDRNGIRSIDGIRFKDQCFLFWYPSSTNSTQSSGAYIFRPDGPARCVGKPNVTVHHGRLFTDVMIKYNNWAEQRFRFYLQHPVVEHEYFIGECPHPGMEVIFRLDTNLVTGNTFITDTNGRGHIRRKRNHRSTWDLKQTEKVAGNYYPVTSKIGIDDKSGRGIRIFPDRAQGGSSLRSGQVELMLLRETINDDGRGVDEPLNDPGQFGNGLIIHGRHMIQFKSNPRESRYGKTQYLPNNNDLEEQIIEKWVFNEPWIAFTKPSQDLSNTHSSFLGLNIKNNESTLVYVVSLEIISQGKLLIRLEHLCTPGIECTTFDRDEYFDFQKCFFPRKIINVTEQNIIGNFPSKHRERLVWPKRNMSSGKEPEDKFKVKISALDLRTFVISFA